MDLPWDLEDFKQNLKDFIEGLYHGWKNISTNGLRTFFFLYTTIPLFLLTLFHMLRSPFLELQIQQIKNIIQNTITIEQFILVILTITNEFIIFAQSAEGIPTIVLFLSIFLIPFFGVVTQELQKFYQTDQYLRKRMITDEEKNLLTEEYNKYITPIEDHLPDIFFEISPLAQTTTDKSSRIFHAPTTTSEPIDLSKGRYYKPDIFDPEIEKLFYPSVVLFFSPSEPSTVFADNRFDYDNPAYTKKEYKQLRIELIKKMEDVKQKIFALSDFYNNMAITIYVLPIGVLNSRERKEELQIFQNKKSELKKKLQGENLSELFDRYIFYLENYIRYAELDDDYASKIYINGYMKTKYCYSITVT
jgi:hypothetical protein